MTIQKFALKRPNRPRIVHGLFPNIKGQPPPADCTRPGAMHYLHLTGDTDYNSGLAEKFSAVLGCLFVTVRFANAESNKFPLITPGY
jgi:hypothetical protein